HQQQRLKDAFNLLSFDFSEPTKDLDHNFAAAVRQVNNYELYQWTQNQPFLDIGSNPLDVIANNCTNTAFSVTPLLDEKDHVRNVFRKRSLQQIANSTSIHRNYAQFILNNDTGHITRTPVP
ncbi:9717_t:CDS:1, partial [Racocetra persica]